MMSLTAEDLQAISTLLEPMRKEISGTKEEVSGLKEEISILKEDVSALKEDVSALKEDVSALKEDVSEIHSTLEKQDKRISVIECDCKQTKKDIYSMQNTIRDMDADLSAIHMVLETQIMYNINAIAGGHLDLSRKLDEALKHEKEKEMYFVRTGNLEYEVQILKQRVDKLAQAQAQ